MPRKTDEKISCACGCGEELYLYDEHYRKREYISGHNNRKYSDPKQHKREWNHKNRASRSQYKKEWLQNFRNELILDAGGECSFCGCKFNYKNFAVFDFHHTDPLTKLFNVNKNNMNKLGKDKILAEAKKCILLCANCHRLHHHEL